VQIVKKKPQFECVLCGLKQSISRIYARSNKAADCRAVVQTYNAARVEMEAAERDSQEEYADSDGYECRREFDGCSEQRGRPRKWGAYVGFATGDDDDSEWTIAAPVPRPGRKQEASRKRQIDPEELENHSLGEERGRQLIKLDLELSSAACAPSSCGQQEFQRVRGNSGADAPISKELKSHIVTRSGTIGVFMEAEKGPSPVTALLVGSGSCTTALGGAPGRWGKYAGVDDEW